MSRWAPVQAQIYEALRDGPLTANEIAEKIGYRGRIRDILDRLYAYRLLGTVVSVGTKEVMGKHRNYYRTIWSLKQ